jgi:hypothetical protein
VLTRGAIVWLFPGHRHIRPQTRTVKREVTSGLPESHSTAHTFRNSRIGEIRLFVMWGLRGWFFEAFCYSAAAPALVVVNDIYKDGRHGDD